MNGPVLPYEEWKRAADGRGKAPVVPAATVVLLRGAGDGIETLMLRKNSDLAFGGMWVFPGGRIDDADHPGDIGADWETAARRAAARESFEETRISVDPDAFVWFAHWVPPPITPRRFATWFFATEVDAQKSAQIDHGEIHDEAWMTPTEALRRHAAGEIELAPPTWVTLERLGRHDDLRGLLAALDAAPARFYETHVGRDADGVLVAMWAGDAGYESGDPMTSGPRHRLLLSEGDFELDDSGAP